jgi:di/tricarboxylate transporter
MWAARVVKGNRLPLVFLLLVCRSQPSDLCSHDDQFRLSDEQDLSLLQKDVDFSHRFHRAATQISAETQPYNKTSLPKSVISSAVLDYSLPPVLSHALPIVPALPHLSPAGKWGTVTIYFLAWLFMMWPNALPLGRPGTALVFAIIALAFRYQTAGLTPADVPAPPWTYIKFSTLGLLIGLMILCTYLKDTAFWHHVEKALDSPSPKQLLVRVSFVSAVTSAFLLNDTVCFVLPPIVLNICRKHSARSALPYLVAISTSANIGSCATIVGNPQNALIASFCPGISFMTFTMVLLYRII